MEFEPAYLRLYDSGELLKRVKESHSHLKACDLCPHNCGVNRLEGETGFCHSGNSPVISGYGPHFGEEKVLVGTNGSGTIFFTFCNMRCVYCQNYEISWMGVGYSVTYERLATIMLELQSKYMCHNINLVTPTHFVPQILEALYIAIERGLKIPLVYNCGGYESIKTLKLLDGVIDIYMPDLKYDNDKNAQRYSGVMDYPRIAQLAIREMHNQVGDLVIDEDGVALRGLIVRHLVLPNGLSGTEGCMRFLASVSPDIFVNIMGQYHPENKAHEYPVLNRRITSTEYKEALSSARRYGIK